MKIIFNNGKSVEISQEIAEIINKKLIDGSKQWQTFSNEHGKVFLMINLNEISYIR